MKEFYLLNISLKNQIDDSYFKCDLKNVKFYTI